MIRKPNCPSAPGGESFAEMLGVYHVCVKLGRCSEELLDYLNDMELVALNAEIASAHAKQNQEAFRVLSSEAGQVAKRMSGAIAEITRRAEALSRNSLSGIVLARLCGKLLEVPRGDKLEFRAGSLRVLEEGIRRSEALVHQTASSIDAVFTEIAQRLSEIERQNKRFETIATYFRIEASRDPESQAYFSNIAQMLRGICARTRACIRMMGAQAEETDLTRRIRRTSYPWDVA